MSGLSTQVTESKALSVLPSADSQGTGGIPPDKAAFQMAASFIDSNFLQSMEQTTFNTYMWSRGYQGWTPVGRSW